MRLPYHRLILFCAATGVVIYSIVVLGFVATSRDLGIRCLFLSSDNSNLPQGVEVRKLEPHFKTWDGHYDLRIGDVIVAIAGEPVKSFSHFNHALIDLRKRPVDPEGTLLAGQSPPESGLSLVETVEGENQNERQRWVRVDFIRPEEAELGTLQAYCELRNPPWNRTLLLSFLWFLLEMSLFSIGALVYWKRPTDDSARLFFTMCLFTVGAFVGGYHWPVIAGSTWLIFPFAFCAMLVPPVSLHFYLLFPRRKAFFYRYRWQTLAVLYTAPAAWTLILLFLMRRVDWLFRHDRPVVEINAALGYLRIAIYSYLVVAAGQFLASVISLAHSYFTSRKRVERNQVRWILAAAILATIPVGYTLYLALEDRAGFALGDSTLPMFLSSVLFILAYAVGITRYKLMQLEQIINRSMLYFAISLAATAVYCATVGIGAILFSSYLGWVQLSEVLGVAVTAMVLAAVFGLLRDRFLRVLDRRLHHEKRQLDTAMRRMSQAVSNLVDPDALAKRMLEAAGDVLGTRRGALFLQTDGQGPYQQIAVNGESQSPEFLPPDSPLVEQLAHRSVVGVHRLGESIPSPAQRQLRRLGYELAHRLGQEGAPEGFVLLGLKRHGGEYATEDIAFLAALSRITTLALQSAAGHRTIEQLNRELKGKVEKIAEQQRRIAVLQSELMRQQPVVETPSAGTLWREEIRGSSPAVERMLSTVRKVARSQSSVLIRGESGTGKELLARAIHRNSPRFEGPFVQVHCAALSSNLLESELFGHVKGAFTGAYRDKVGRFELADGGTFFLDEIGDINLETQTKLLRVLQEMAFERVGGTETIKIDMRLIAATNQNLEKLIEAGRFREDLFYRLNVISIQTPPLRERKEDIFELALHFLTDYGPRMGKRVTGIDDEAMEALACYSWPGNIRELENVIERAVVMTDGETILIDDLPQEVINPARIERSGKALLVGATAAAGGSNVGQSPPRDPWQEAELPGELTGYERRRLVDALEQNQGNKSQAARALGLPRSTFFSKLKKYGLT